MKKILLVFAGMLPMLLSAQSQGSFVHFDFGGGMHTMLFTPDGGKRSVGAGVTLDVSYRYYFSRNLGVRVGLGMSTARSKAVLNCTEEMAWVDPDGTDCQRRAIFTDWTEKQSLFDFEVPVGLCVQAPVSRTLSFIWDAGVALAVPLNNDYEIASGTMETRVYYPSTHHEVAGDESVGAKTYETDKASHRLPFGNCSCNLFTNLGFHYSKRGSLPLYFGLYVSGGVASIVKANDQNLFTERYNGLLASNRVNGVFPLAVGVKIGLALDCDRQCRGGRCGFN